MRHCLRCARKSDIIRNSLVPSSPSTSTTPSLFFFSKRTLLTRPLLQISPPDPNNPPPDPPKRTQIKRDPGVTLGEQGIPVPQTRQRPPASVEERAWTETVFRTLSGGMKSDYLKCTCSFRRSAGG